MPACERTRCAFILVLLSPRSLFIIAIILGLSRPYTERKLWVFTKERPSAMAGKLEQVAIVLSREEVVELKMIVQDEDEAEALEFLVRLRRKVADVERRHCGDPDRLPGL